MPKRKPKSPKVPVTLDAAKPEKPRSVIFTTEQRARLFVLLNDPIFVIAWQNAELARPPIFANGLDAEGGERRGNNILHQLQGWEMHKLALIHQTEERRVAVRLEENYPDSGTLEADAARRLAIQRAGK